MKTYLTMALCLCFAGGLQAKKDKLESQHAYVTNYLDNTVSVIDTETNRGIATIPVGVAPFALAVNATGPVYVLNGDNTVSVIDPATNKVTATVSLRLIYPYTYFPSSVAVSLDGSTVYIGENRGGGALIKINTTTNVASADGGDRVTGLLVNPVSGILYIWELQSLLFSSDGKTVTTNPTTAAVGGMAISPDGNTLYIPYWGNNTISVVDTRTDTVRATIPIGAEALATSPDGSTVYATTAPNSISVINTHNYSVKAVIPVGKAPDAIAVSENGSVYVVNHADNSVSVINPHSKSVEAVISVGSGATDIAIQ